MVEASLPISVANLKRLIFDKKGWSSEWLNDAQLFFLTRSQEALTNDMQITDKMRQKGYEGLWIKTNFPEVKEEFDHRSVFKPL